MIDIISKNLITSCLGNDCIACTEPTNTQTKCCLASICCNCYLKWIRSKRECMHCNRYQCDLEEWVNNYKTDSEELTHNFLGLEDPFSFLTDMQTLIQNNNGGTNNLLLNLEQLDRDFIDEDLMDTDFEYGFTVEQPGNEPMTVTNTIPSSALSFEELRNILNQY